MKQQRTGFILFLTLQYLLLISMIAMSIMEGDVLMQKMIDNYQNVYLVRS